MQQPTDRHSRLPNNSDTNSNPPTAPAIITDDYVAMLLASDALKRNAQYHRDGPSALLPHTADSSPKRYFISSVYNRVFTTSTYRQQVMKTDLGFLRNIIRHTNSHNHAMRSITEQQQQQQRQSTSSDTVGDSKRQKTGAELDNKQYNRPRGGGPTIIDLPAPSRSSSTAATKRRRRRARRSE